MIHVGATPRLQKSEDRQSQACLLFNRPNHAYHCPLSLVYHDSLPRPRSILWPVFSPANIRSSGKNDSIGPNGISPSEISPSEISPSETKRIVGVFSLSEVRPSGISPIGVSPSGTPPVKGYYITCRCQLERRSGYTAVTSCYVLFCGGSPSAKVSSDRTKPHSPDSETENPPKTECGCLHSGAAVIENGRTDKQTSHPTIRTLTCTCACTGAGAHTPEENEINVPIALGAFRDTGSWR